jgi:AraC-like DNA-binding protein
MRKIGRTQMKPSARANSLAARIAALAVAEGANATRHPGVTVYRVSESQPPIPTLYAASLIIVGQGVKRGYLGNKTYEYNAGNYLQMTSPMPMLCEIVAASREPVLTVAIEIDLGILRQLILELEDVRPRRALDLGPGVHVAPLTAPLESAAARLLDYLTDASAARVLAPQTIREILFHALHGPTADALRNLASTNSRAAQLSRVLRHMNEHFATPTRVEDLARMAHMSVPTFHENFRAVTFTTPLQYLKAIRLTKARHLMLQSALAANLAARAVGYESESQFSREFRRFFGRSPVAEVEKTRRSMATFAGGSR